MLLVPLLDAYTLVILGAVFASWMKMPPSHPIANLLRVLTEPLLAPIRQRLPAMGGIDFSPFVLFIAVRLVRGLVFSAGL